MSVNKNFWDSQEPNLILNPRMAKEDQLKVINAVKNNSQGAVVWLQSSGTESKQKGMKIVCLEKAAILVAAKSVNSFLGLRAQDVWLNSLPLFHIGGLSISARCFLVGATEILFPNWNPDLFVEEIKSKNVTFCSLVPTQLYDLVRNNIVCPSSLRILLLGGGPLSQEIYKKALELKWPVCPSYGMTETSAMVAGVNYVDFKKHEIPSLKILNHVQFIAWQDKFEIQSQSLFKGFLWVFENGEYLWDERPTTFIIDDRIEIKNNSIRVLGRESEIVKILGETVNITTLEEKLEKIIEAPVALVAKIEERKGFDLFLYIESNQIQMTLEEINKNLMPFERVKDFKVVDKFSRSALGKVIKSELS